MNEKVHGTGCPCSCIKIQCDVTEGFDELNAYCAKFSQLYKYILTLELFKT